MWRQVLCDDDVARTSPEAGMSPHVRGRLHPHGAGLPGPGTHCAELPHGRAGVHAVIIVGIEEEQVICLDPTLEVELRLTLFAFLEVWSGLGNQGMVVWV